MTLFDPPARIAVLVPSSDTGVEIELPRRIGGAASLHVARMPLDSVTPRALCELESAALEQAVGLRHVSPNLGLFGCTSATFLRGVTFEAGFVAALEERLGAPVITAAQAMVRALSARGTRVRLLASYSEEIVAAETEYLFKQGLEVVSSCGFGIVNDEETAAVSPDRLSAEAARLSGDDAEVIMLSCTNLRTLAVIPRIEAELGLPVVSSNSALAEAALIALEIPYATRAVP